MSSWTLTWVLAWTLMVFGTATAQEAEQTTDDLNVTMQIIEDPAAVLPEAVTRRIELPSGASGHARDAAQPGLDTADDARQHREQGWDNATEAREQNREWGLEMAEQAAAERENFGRSKAESMRPETPEPQINPPAPPRP